MKTQKVLINGKIPVFIPDPFEYSVCSCGAEDIIWAKTLTNKNMPVRFDADRGWICHFDDCKNASNFRKPNPKYVLDKKK